MDIQKIREDFPILSRTVYGKPLVYFDNGATTQKPRLVVDALVDEYYSVNANVHRGVHYLSQQATELHEASRETVRQFINARSTSEVVFTRGTTESINLLVSSFGDEFMQEGDEVILSVMEHCNQSDSDERQRRTVVGRIRKIILRTHEDCQCGACVERIGYGESGEGNDCNSTCSRCTLSD